MARKPVVYVIGPYRGGDTARNVSDAMDAWVELWESKLITPICPHLTHFQHLRQYRPHEEWIQWCLEIATTADAAVRLPGASAGGDREQRLLEGLGKPVFWPISACLEWAQKVWPGVPPLPPQRPDMDFG